MKAKSLRTLDKFTSLFEIVIAALLLVVVAIEVFQIGTVLAGRPVAVLSMEFDRILSIALALVIGVEFTKMLYKHTPDTVIDVLLFAVARHMVMYHERTMDMLIGAVSIAGLFAAKKYLIDKRSDSDKDIV